MSSAACVPVWDPARAFTWVDGERRIEFGRGVAARVVEAVDAEYVLLTTRRGAADAAGLARSADAVHMVAEGRVEDLARALRPRVRGGTLVALGGGRVIDVAKALAAADPPRRVVAIPTTLSGAEMTATHRMVPGLPPGRRRVRPALVIADPLVMCGLPQPMLVGSAMNALAHTVEAPLTRRAHPVAVLAAGAAADLLCAGLPGMDADSLALGAVLAGYALGAAGYGMHQVLAQTVARASTLEHGAVNAVLLPHSLAALARRFGEAAVRPGVLEAARDGVARAPAQRLRDLGVAREALPALDADAADRPELADTPPPPRRQELLDLLEAAW